MENEDGELRTTDRVTAVGSFLRRTSADELPQLWNVLLGDMSFVGPRPLPVQYLPLFTEAEHKRHDVKPGITGWAQVNGRHEIAWSKKFEFDMYYVDHLSLWFDLKVLFKTVILVLAFGKDRSLGEKPFTGN